MNKKQLRQRILDVAAGAGMKPYYDEGEVIMWEHYDDPCVDFAKLVMGLRRAFDLDDNSILTRARNLDNYKTIDTLTDFFWRNKEQLS